MKDEIIDTILNTPLYGLIGVSRNRLVYVSTEEGYNGIWSSDLKGENRIRLYDKPFFIHAFPRWESKYVVYVVDATRGYEHHLIYYSDIEEGWHSLALDINPARITGIAFYDNEIVYTASTRKKIFIAMGRFNERPTKVIDIDLYVRVIDFNGRYIILEGNKKYEPDKRKVFIYDTKGDEFLSIQDDEGTSTSMPRLYKDKLLYLAYSNGDIEIRVCELDNMRCKTLEILKNLNLPMKSIDILNLGWGNDSEIWVSIKNEGRCILTVDGNVIPTPKGYISNTTIYNKVIYYNHSSIMNPTSLWKYLPDKQMNIKILGADTPEILRKNIREIGFVKYKSKDRLEIPSFLILNKKAEKEALIYIHGGPWREMADRWSVTVSILAAAGYHIMIPNYRGSRGYGEEFRRLLIGDPGGMDLEDIVYAYKYLIEEEISKDVGLVGFSYGGFLALLAVGKYPRLWKYVVAGSGICDWESIYKNSDYSFRRFIEILFKGDLELMRERSPKKYIENIEAPLCIVQPENDTRTPLNPILECVEKLKRLNKVFELHIIRDTGHILDTNEKFVRKFIPVLDFLRKYSK